MSFDERMETYYQKFIDLQEKLRKSEEDRLTLEMKFNEMLQISREEERSHYRKLRSQYKRFLDEDRKRQERNEKILRTLERIESRISSLSSKTERFRCLRRQYKSYLQRVNQQALPSQSIEENYNPEESYNSPLALKSAIKKSNEDKLEILEKYLKSLNSHKRERHDTEAPPKAPSYEEDLKKLDMFSKNLKDGFDSNRANSIAEEIMNSIYSRHYKKEDSKKTPKSKYSIYEDNSDYDDDRDKNHILRRNQNRTQSDKGSKDTWKTLNCDKKHVRINETDYGIQKIYDHTEHEGQDIPVNKNEDGLEESSGNNVGEAQQGARCVNVNSDTYKVLNGHEVPELDAMEATSFNNMSKIHTAKLNQSEATNEEISDTENSKQIEGYKTLDNKPSNAINQQLDSNQEQYEKKSSGEVVSQVERSQRDDDITNEENEAKTLEQQGIIESDQSNESEVNQQHFTESYQRLDQTAQPPERFEQKKIGVTHVQNVQEYRQLLDQHYDELEKPLQYDNRQIIEDAGQPQAVDSNIQQYDEAGQIDDTGQLIPQNTKSSKDQRYDGSELRYDGNDPSLAEYDEKDQLIQQHKDDALRDQQYATSHLQYDENDQHIAQYDENGQLIQQYVEGDPNSDQYAEGQLQYDENGQPIAQYDENGQLVQHQQYQEEDPKAQQYTEGQIQYDENGQLIAQYDENGQLIQQYQEDNSNAGQYAEGQYDEDGQPIAQYDKNGQLVHYQQYQEEDPKAQQYAEGQLQYDENGQIMAQYDENGQLIQQYQEDNSNAGQYAEGQYDENGQPVAQYDENGQLIQQYQEGDTNVDQCAESQLQYDGNGQHVAQYDENGQLIQQYEEDNPNAGQYAEGQLQYDENGKPVAQYDENGQLIQQYQEGDTNVDQYAESQLQYDENGQPVAQYDESQMQYDENGQPFRQYAQQYDPNEQYYDENGQPVDYTGTAQSYDRNGQLIQQYDENNPQLEQEYQEHLQDSVVEDKEQASGEKADIGVKPLSKEETKDKSKDFNVLDLLETDTDVSVKENTSKITNDSDFDFSNT